MKTEAFEENPADDFLLQAAHGLTTRAGGTPALLLHCAKVRAEWSGRYFVASGGRDTKFDTGA
jgi:hypothetical protein